jgi:hypothetical protein
VEPGTTAVGAIGATETSHSTGDSGAIMEFLRLVLIFLHFIGLAAVIGGFLAQLFAPTGAVRAAKTMLHGGLTQLVTGIGLVGLYEGPLDEPVNHAKIGVKLLVALAVVSCVLIGNRRTEGAGGLYRAAGLLAVVNVGVAVFWTTS